MVCLCALDNFDWRKAAARVMHAAASLFASTTHLCCDPCESKRCQPVNLVVSLSSANKNSPCTDSFVYLLECFDGNIVLKRGEVHSIINFKEEPDIS